MVGERRESLVDQMDGFLFQSSFSAVESSFSNLSVDLNIVHVRRSQLLLMGNCF